MRQPLVFFLLGIVACILGVFFFVAAVSKGSVLLSEDLIPAYFIGAVGVANIVVAVVLFKRRRLW